MPTKFFEGGIGLDPTYESKSIRDAHIPEEALRAQEENMDGLLTPAISTRDRFLKIPGTNTAH